MSFRFCLPGTSHPRGLNAPISGKENPPADRLGPSSRLDPGERKDTTFTEYLLCAGSMLVSLCCTRGFHSDDENEESLNGYYNEEGEKVGET